MKTETLLIVLAVGGVAWWWSREQKKKAEADATVEVSYSIPEDSWPPPPSSPRGYGEGRF